MPRDAPPEGGGWKRPDASGLGWAPESWLSCLEAGVVPARRRHGEREPC